MLRGTLSKGDRYVCIWRCARLILAVIVCVCVCVSVRVCVCVSSVQGMAFVWVSLAGSFHDMPDLTVQSTHSYLMHSLTAAVYLHIGSVLRK